MLFMVAVIFLASVYIFIVYASLNTRVLNKSKSKLESQGYSKVFHGCGDKFVAFNVESGRFRIGNLRYYNYIEEPLSSIVKYEWLFNEGDGEEKNNKFFFYMPSNDLYTSTLFLHSVKISGVVFYAFNILYKDGEFAQTKTEWLLIQEILGAREQC
ncbi:MAG: hypothetical protein ACI9D5_001755 [Candidatus Endobugula sp.]